MGSESRNAVPGSGFRLSRESRFIALPTRVASRWKFAGCGCTSLSAGCAPPVILLGLILLLLSPYVLLVGQPCPDPCHFYEKGPTFCGNSSLMRLANTHARA